MPVSSQETVCARIAQRLEDAVGPYRYGMWFDRSARLNYSDHPHRLEVSVPNRFVAEWIGRNFQDELRVAASDELGGPVELHVNVDPKPFEKAKHRGPERKSRGSTRSRRNGSQPAKKSASLRHQLEDFVVGSGNELAFSAAHRLVDEDFDAGSAATPLFVHGGVGLGKTHLLQGICQRLLNRKPNARVLYTTGERFTNEYITAVRANKLEAFRKKVRRLDLLAVDDVHFMANKHKTQQEFLHCFDAIELNGSRVVMASDNHPKLIQQFSEALVSRCVRGLVVEVKPPDTETRVRIVQTLAKRRGISLMETVVAVLASRCQGSVREIEGTLSKLHALAKLLPQVQGELSPVKGDDPIGHTLVNQLFSLERESSPRRIIQFDTIVDVVCDKLNLRREDVMGKSRQRHVVLGRSLSIYLTRQMTSMSFPEIAAAMGRTSHSTIVTASGRVERQLGDGTSGAGDGGPAMVTMPGSMEQTALPDLVNRLQYAVERA